MGRTLIDDAGALPALGDGHHVSPRATRKDGRPARRLYFPEAGLANDHEITALARIFDDYFKKFMPMRFRVSGDPTWLDLYHFMDIDNSGSVDFDEFSLMVRNELNVKKSNLPEASLRSLWNALDGNASGDLGFGEVRISFSSTPTTNLLPPAPC